MDLENDAFAVEYNPAGITTGEMMTVITGLGYRPRVADTSPPKEPEPQALPSDSFPEPLATAFRKFSTEPGRLYFIDFYAKWCGPCRQLESKVLSSPSVETALRSFGVLKIDTDEFPQAATYFTIKSLPTLMVIDRETHEYFRHVGPIDVETLVGHLTAVCQSTRTE